MNAAVRLVRLLRGKGLTVTTAESMTGGLIAGAITSVPGASEVLSLALCTYSNEAKRRFLGVSASTIAAHTEISAPCAREMARGAAALAGADLALSVTGLAGAKTRRTPFAKSSPDDGTVFIGVCCRGDARAYRFRFAGTRAEIRRKAVFKNIVNVAGHAGIIGVIIGGFQHHLAVLQHLEQLIHLHRMQFADFIQKQHAAMGAADCSRFGLRHALHAQRTRALINGVMYAANQRVRYVERKKVFSAPFFQRIKRSEGPKNARMVFEPSGFCLF